MDSVPSEGGCHIEDLPDEVFAKILNLVPIKQVIRCSIVSKRWDAACRYIIRTREYLVIGWYNPFDTDENKWGWDRVRPSWRLDNITLTDKSLVSAMMKTLNQMAELTRLSVDTSIVNLANIIPFVRKFAEQLTMLKIDFSVSMIGADVFPHLTRLRCRHFDANSSAAFSKLTELFICGLKNNEKLPNMRLPSLKKLLIKKFCGEDDAELVEEFILANAETLTDLEMSGIRLRLDHAVVFPNLKKLNCLDMDDAGSYGFPALTHLTATSVSVFAEFLSSLPAYQMLSLEVDFRFGMDDVVSAISQMLNLKSLKLTDSGWSKTDTTFSGIFDNMYLLEEVQLVSYSYRKEEEDDDVMIATLVNQNPKLSLVHLHGIRLSDAALTSLAQLQHLSDVSLAYCEKITTDGILTLLCGASRSVIRKFSVSRENVDRYPVTREICLMCEERGTTFDAPYSGRFFEFDIHA